MHTHTTARDYQSRAGIIEERAKDANEHNARELYLAALNTSEMYKAAVEPTVAALRRHARRGEYSEEGALVAWRNAADRLAHIYCRIYAGQDVVPGAVFSPADRCSVAVQLAHSERETVFFGLASKEG